MIESIKIGERYVVHGLPVRVLCQAFSIKSYCEPFVVVNDTPWGQLLGHLFYGLSQIQIPLASWEAKRLKVVGGEPFPIYSFSYWIWQLFYCPANRFGRKERIFT